MRKKLCGLLIACGLLLTAGCGQTFGTASSKELPSAMMDVFAMDTYMTVTAYGTKAEAAVTAAIDEIQRLDELLTATGETGETYQVNQNGGGSSSEDGMYLLERSLELYQNTEGAFNVAIFPVMKAWGFVDDVFAVPEAEQLQEALALAVPEEIQIASGDAVITFLKEGMAIDFGGIAKGYTSVRVTEILKDYGIASAVINLGGNVQVLGTKTDGSAWRVGVIDPADPDNTIGVLETADKAVITSGGYERYFEQDGIRYHHIIDPATGYPTENGLASVTIVSADGVLADGLSTSLFVMGQEKGTQYWREHSDQFDVIFVTDGGEIFVTEGLADAFTSEKTVQIIQAE